MPLQIHQFPCLSDNYGYLVHDRRSGQTVAIDAPDAAAIQTELRRQGWGLDYLFNTHHHADHVGGNLALKEQTGCTIFGPAAEAARIPGLDRALEDNDSFSFGEQQVNVLHVPGHTLGHIAYHLPDAGVIFVGDTLFSLGCGRLFEGTAAQMWQSLQKLLRLPDATRVYCAHEYTQANGSFARTLEPRNPDLRRRCEQVDELRRQGQSTLPTTIGLERKTNPFLRVHCPDLQEAAGLRGAAPVAVFARIRGMKDRF